MYRYCTSSFPYLRLLGSIFIYSTVNRTFCIQIVETLIRNRDLQRLAWFCIVRICPTERTQGLYGFKTTVSEASIIVNARLFLSLTVFCMIWLVGFVALRPKSTAMVIAGRSVHLTILFPGQA